MTASAAAFTAPALNVQDDPRYGILFLSYEGAVRRGVVFWPDVAGIVESKAQGGKDLFVLLLRSGAFVQAPLAENSDVFARSEATKRNLAGVSLAELAAARATGQAYHDLVSRADVGALTDLVVRELAARTKAGAG